MPNWLHKSYHNRDSNWAPLSVVIVAGVTKRAIHPLKKASATISILMSTNIWNLLSMAKGQLCRYVRTLLNLSVGSVNLPKTGLLRRETLAVWQPLHVQHQFATSLILPCYMKRVLMRGCVALCDGWPKPCKLVKTCLRNLGVTFGLLRSVTRRIISEYCRRFW